MLIKMGIKYGSEDSLNLCSHIARVILNTALLASTNLAVTKGTFPMYNYNKLRQSKFYNTNVDDNVKNAIAQFGLRNSQLLTIAPTGTLSTMLGISGGIEPIFANYYERKTESLYGEDKYFKVYTPIVKEYMQNNNLDDDSKLPEYFVTASDLTALERVRMQSTWQKYVDASISSTVNLPEEATVDDIAEIYLNAYKYGLKGITVFRSGCRRAGILTAKPKDNSNTQTEPQLIESTNNTLPRGFILDASDNLIGKKRKLQTGCVDSETEFFNGQEWKKISDYTPEDLVLQYNIDGSASLVEPLQYIKRKSLGMYHISTKYGLDMMVSPDHRNVVFTNKDSKPRIKTTQELIDSHNRTTQGTYVKFKTSFTYSGSGISLTDDEIRISIAIFADGCFYSPTSKKCIVSVTKKRKRDRLIDLLSRSNIEYTERFDSDGYYNIKFYPPIHGRQKVFPKEWYKCTKHQFEVICSEIFLWDGYAKKCNQYSTIVKSNADFVQFALTVIGHRSSIYKDKRRDNICYRVDWNDRKYISIINHNEKTNIPFVMSTDGYEYCFSVPSTMLVLRRNNKIFVTGNCGSLHCTAFFDPDTGDLMETYLSRGSTGGCSNSYTGLSRMISLSARAGVDIDTIVDQLNSSGVCPSYYARRITKHDTSPGSSCPVAIGKALKDMWQEMQDEIADDIVFGEDKPKYKVENVVSVALKDKDTNKVVLDLSSEKCPECGEPLQHEGGCDICKNCGYSHCG